MNVVQPGLATHGRQAARPRIGFLGVGWIGLDRMKALLHADLIEAVAIAEPDKRMAEAARQAAPGARMVSTLDELVSAGVDGVVIATPSALHAQQSIAALDAGVAVFCQKPLGRTAAEVEEVVAAARRADRLLGVDLSYRFAEGMRRVRDLVVSGELGTVFAADLVFHNAYGPDKPWFYDPALSGGGCVMDLGVHLVDLALWTLGSPEVEEVGGSLFSKGEPVRDPREAVEDYATATIRLAGGAEIRLACSWGLHAGQDAVISAAFHGTGGGASFRNVGGSFYDFTAEHYRGTARSVLAEPPDSWGGRAAMDWAQRLALDAGYDRDAESLVTVARVLDGIYGRAM